MFKYLLKFIKFAGKQRKHMIIALVFGLLQSVFTAFSLLATAYALQNMIEGTATMSTVWSAFGVVGGGVLLAAVCNYFSTQFLTYAGYTIAANARIRIADKLKYAPMGYFNEHNLGQIANTATNTAESLQDTEFLEALGIQALAQDVEQLQIAAAVAFVHALVLRAEVQGCGRCV